ncbi:MAG: glutathione S-transferase [Psychrobium sp.]|nr:glutathione S-transferase [Psychrobium sp.]
MKLYEYAMAPNARRVSVFLAEIDLQVERINVDIRGGENIKQQFKDKAVNGLIPLLELNDGTCIGESVAICRYLESISGQATSLFGDTPLEVAEIEMWHRIVEFQVMMPALQAFRNLSGIYKDRETVVPQWGEVSKQRYLAALPMLDKQLSENKYLASNRFSMADITLFSIINFMRVLKLNVPDDLPNLQRWLSETKERDSVKSTELDRAATA